MSGADATRPPPAQDPGSAMEWRELMLAPIIVESLHAAGIDLAMAGGGENAWPQDSAMSRA